MRLYKENGIQTFAILLTVFVLLSFYLSTCIWIEYTEKTELVFTGKYEISVQERLDFILSYKANYDIDDLAFYDMHFKADYALQQAAGIFKEVKTKEPEWRVDFLKPFRRSE